MLSISLCVCWPFVYLLQRNAYLNPLSIFKLCGYWVTIGLYYTSDQILPKPLRIKAKLLTVAEKTSGICSLFEHFSSYSPLTHLYSSNWLLLDVCPSAFVPTVPLTLIHSHIWSQDSNFSGVCLIFQWRLACSSYLKIMSHFYHYHHYPPFPGSLVYSSP